jgi:hypothetical protein
VLATAKQFSACRMIENIAHNVMQNKRDQSRKGNMVKQIASFPKHSHSPLHAPRQPNAGQKINSAQCVKALTWNVLTKLKLKETRSSQASLLLV